MKGYLQFSQSENGFYSDVGQLRPAAGAAYIVKPYLDEDRSGLKSVIGYFIDVRAATFDLHNAFLSAEKWFFRIRFDGITDTINLGYRFYAVQYDALMTRNGQSLTEIRITFSIPKSEFAQYTTLSGGGAVPQIEDISLII
jgi:hypothetical protein